MKFDRHTIWETQAVNTDTMPLNTWFKMSAAKQREIFGFKIFGRKSISLNLEENTILVMRKIAYGHDANETEINMDHLVTLVENKRVVDWI